MGYWSYSNVLFKDQTPCAVPLGQYDILVNCAVFQIIGEPLQYLLLLLYYRDALHVMQIIGNKNDTSYCIVGASVNCKKQRCPPTQSSAG